MSKLDDNNNVKYVIPTMCKLDDAKKKNDHLIYTKRQINNLLVRDILNH